MVGLTRGIRNDTLELSNQLEEVQKWQRNLYKEQSKDQGRLPLKQKEQE
jgi:hypothetical protein